MITINDSGCYMKDFDSWHTTFKAKCHIALIDFVFRIPAANFMRHYVQAGPWADMIREG